MSSISITKLYDLLAMKMDKDSARALISYIEEKIEFDNRSTSFATKEDLANSKSETIKWLFAFWVGQVATTFGIILYFLKK